MTSTSIGSSIIGASRNATRTLVGGVPGALGGAFVVAWGFKQYVLSRSQVTLSYPPNVRTLTQSQVNIAELKLNDTSLPAQTRLANYWRYLGESGDYYAALSFEVTSNPSAFLYKYGRAVWEANGRNTATNSTYADQYQKFSLLQAENYLDQIKFGGGPNGLYVLPSSDLIERSYFTTIGEMNSVYGANLDFGYVGHATFAYANKLTGGATDFINFGWEDFLGLPDWRQDDTPNTPFTSVSAGEMLKIMEGTVSALVDDGYAELKDWLDFSKWDLNPFTSNFIDGNGNPIQLAYAGGNNPVQLTSTFFDPSVGASVTETFQDFRSSAGYSGDPNEIVVQGIRDVVINGQNFRIRFEQNARGEDIYKLDNPAGFNAALAAQAFSAFGQNLLSGIGASLFDDQAASIAASSFLGRFGSLLLAPVSQRTSVDIAQGAIPAKDTAARDFFGTSAGQTIIGIGSDVLSSYAILELGNALGIKGFGAELFSTVGQGLASQVTNNALNIAAGQLSSDQLFSNGLRLDQIFDPQSGVLSAAALGSFFGRMVGRWIISPTNTVGAIAASALSAAGSTVLVASTLAALPGAAAAGAVASTGVIGSIAAAFASVGPFAGPLLASGVGALVGFVLGALFGTLFGRRKPRIPTANAETSLNLTTGYWQSGAVTSQNGGSRALVSDMASASKDTLNGIISLVIGGQDIAPNANPTQPMHKYGHTGNTIWFDRWAGTSWARQYSGDSASDAVDRGIVSGIKDTRIRGGDLIMKRAIAGSKATATLGLAADLSVARDYATYLRSRDFFNRSFAADPNSEATAGWLVTLLRAGELGLTKYQASDFFGGLAGFAESFGFGSGGAGFEKLGVAFEGSDLRVSTVDGSASFGLLAGSNNITDPTLAAQSAFIANFGANVGYTNWAGSATAGNDIWIASSAASGVTMDDTSTVWEYVWTGYEYYYLPVTVTGGDDIFVGSVHADTLYGRAGWDWLDGGGGNDVIDGGDNDDVLLGRAGGDRMLGGAGNDYISGGDGNDYFYDATQNWGGYGGEGNDTLVGNAGTDSLYGENGDDIFIVDQDGGGIFDAYEGQNGSDTVSYERFNAGVSIDFNVLGGWSWDPSAKYIYGDSISNIENLTGTYFNDNLLGDSGANVIRGLGGNDNIDGGLGNDVLEGGVGADILRGGFYTDTASYESSASGVIVSLDAQDVKFDPEYYLQIYPDVAWAGMDPLLHYNTWGWSEGRNPNAIFNTNYYLQTYPDIQNAGVNPFTHYQDAGVHEGRLPSAAVAGNTVAVGGDASGDQLYSMENLRGSKFNDELAGNGGNNVLEGLRGDDTFTWTAGNDTINGGDGFDIFDASAATGGLTVSSGYYASVSGQSGTSYLTSVEAYIGTVYADNITGTVADELFDAGLGADYLSGGAGSDTYVYGRGMGYDTVNETTDGANGITISDDSGWRNIVVTGPGGTGSLVVAIRGDSTGQLVVGTNFSYVTSGTNAGNHNHKIKTLDIGGVSTIDIDMVDWMPAGAASAAATVVNGGQNKADLIFAYEGDDTIYAAGSYSAYENRGNVIYAGDGNDYIVSSSGDDQFIFEYGNGIDTLIDSGGIDTIVMGPSVSADDVIYSVIITGSDAEGGQTADLYVGLRDPNNPNLGASQVSDRIRIVDGATIYFDLDTSQQRFNTVEHVRVGGQEIDLTKADIDWVTSYYHSYGGPGGGGHIPPLAIDLDGDGIELRSVHGSRVSTVDADGAVWRIGWLGQDDGFLALDRNGDGIIDRLNEISFTQDLEGAKSDLEGLAAYDSNGDGKLDAADARWSEFSIWQDKNQDGIGTEKELVTLEEAGIASISLRGQATGFTTAEGIDNTILATTIIEWTDPDRIGLGYDVALAAYQVRTDGGGQETADANARVKGEAGGDVVDASLIGIQALTAAEIEAHKEKPKNADLVSEEGMLGRVETFLPGAAKNDEGLLSLTDADAVHRRNHDDAQNAEMDGKNDKFSDDDWSVGGSLTTPVRDTSGDAVTAAMQELTPEQLGELERAKAYFDEQTRLADAEAAERDGEAPIAASPIPIPDAAELAAAAARDKFKLLTADTDEKTSADLKEKEAVPDIGAESSMPLAPSRSFAETATTGVSESNTLTSAEAAGDREPVTLSNAPKTSQYLPAAPSELDEPSAELDYGVRIQMANARLIQALGGFGDAPAMMAHYRGLSRDSELAQENWLTIGHQISVRHLASVS